MATFLNDGVNPNYEKAIFNNGYRKALEDMGKAVLEGARDVVPNAHQRVAVIELVRKAQKELMV